MLKILIVGLTQVSMSILARLSQFGQIRILGVLSPEPAIGELMDGLIEQGIPLFGSAAEIMDEPDVILNTANLSEAELHRLLGTDRSAASVLSGRGTQLIKEIVAEEERQLQNMERVSWERDVIFNSTHDGLIAINRDGLVTLFNQSAERILRRRAADCIGRHVTEVVPNSRLHLILATGVEEINKNQIIDDTSMIITNRIPIRDREGRIVGAVAVFRDMTDLQNLAEEVTSLKEMRVMLEAIIESTQDAISVVDENGLGIVINPAYTRLTGFTKEDIIGKPATVDIAEGESMHLQVLKTRQPVSGVRLKVGPKKKEVIVNVAPIMVDGRLKGSVGVIHDISEIKKLTDELNQARRMIRQLNAKYTFDDIIADSKLMLAAIQQARKASRTPATVLLRGESGTGKELFAHAIHNSSPRADGQFIRVNCAAITDTLLESELFGYEEGAFTGARKGGKKGFFEEAHSGTIFLDEVGKMNMKLQAKLLRVLQEREVMRVGDTKAIPIDVRVIVATNANLERMIQEGTFREDLYYRLNVVPIFIPPLRKRKEDIPKLAHHLVRKYNQEYGRLVQSFSRDALDLLMGYDWPGNVRELENIVGRAMINVSIDSDMITAEHLPPLGMEGPARAEKREMPGGIALTEYDIMNKSLKDILDEVEKDVILGVLEQTQGNKTDAARILGIAIRSLYYKLEKYGIA